MTRLSLDRPLAVLDIESTGTNPRTDRIIELAIVKLLPGGGREERTWRFQPLDEKGQPMAIPREASAIHGITNEDVAGEPAFRDRAAEVVAFLDGCDLAGYNAIRFDVPMLAVELERAGQALGVEGRFLVDPQRIYHQREPRDLSAALAFYCGERHEGAHGALADALATVQVLEGQLEKYGDLPATPRELDSYCRPKHPHWVDAQGRLIWRDGKVAIGFGRNQGALLEDLVRDNNGYLAWILGNDFPEDTKQIIREAQGGTYPAPPAGEDG